MKTAAPVIARVLAIGCIGAIVVLTGPPSAIAVPRDMSQVDQACDAFDPHVHAYLNIGANAPVGQEFVPELTSLDCVQAYTKEGSLGGTAGVELLVRIREGSIDGPIVGSSDTLSLPHDHIGVTEFSFSTAVPLVPRTLYVIEMVHVWGDDWMWRHHGMGFDLCPGIRLINNGTPDETNDFWFREGIASDSPVERTTWGVIKMLYE